MNLVTFLSMFDIKMRDRKSIHNENIFIFRVHFLLFFLQSLQSFESTLDSHLSFFSCTFYDVGPSNKIQFLVFLGWGVLEPLLWKSASLCINIFFSIANLLFKVIKHLEKYYCVNMNGKNWTKKGHWVTLYYELIISNYHAMIFHCYTLFSISKLCPKKYSKIP